MTCIYLYYISYLYYIIYVYISGAGCTCMDLTVVLLQVGEGGAGHFVKMVHNGIEYGDMQLICEAYHLMKVGLGMGNDEMSKVST